MTPAGLPHSDTHGSMPAGGSPWLLAAYHVLPRPLAPRHPPRALSNSTPLGTQSRQDRDQQRNWFPEPDFSSYALVKAPQRPIGLPPSVGPWPSPTSSLATDGQLPTHRRSQNSGLSRPKPPRYTPTCPRHGSTSPHPCACVSRGQSFPSPTPHALEVPTRRVEMGRLELPTSCVQSRRSPS